MYYMNGLRYQMWLERLEDAAFSGDTEAEKKLIDISKRINGKTKLIYPWKWLKSNLQRECA